MSKQHSRWQYFTIQQSGQQQQFHISIHLRHCPKDVTRNICLLSHAANASFRVFRSRFSVWLYHDFHKFLSNKTLVFFPRDSTTNFIRNALKTPDAADWKRGGKSNRRKHKVFSFKPSRNSVCGIGAEKCVKNCTTEDLEYECRANWHCNLSRRNVNNTLSRLGMPHSKLKEGRKKSCWKKKLHNCGVKIPHDE